MKLKVEQIFKNKIQITVYRRNNFNPKFNQFLNREDQVARMGRHQNHKLFRSSTWLRIGELCELSVWSVRGSDFAAFQKVFGVCVWLVKFPVFKDLRRPRRWSW